MKGKEGETGRKGTRKLVGDFEGQRSIVGGDCEDGDAVELELWNWVSWIGKAVSGKMFESTVPSCPPRPPDCGQARANLLFYNLLVTLKRD